MPWPCCKCWCVSLDSAMQLTYTAAFIGEWLRIGWRSLSFVLSAQVCQAVNAWCPEDAVPLVASVILHGVSPLKSLIDVLLGFHATVLYLHEPSRCWLGALMDSVALVLPCSC